MEIRFTNKGFDDYLFWQSQDKKTLKRINKLLIDLQRNGFNSRMGHAEILKGNTSFSMRIDEQNRLVYTYEDNHMVILKLRGHY